MIIAVLVGGCTADDDGADDEAADTCEALMADVVDRVRSDAIQDKEFAAMSKQLKNDCAREWRIVFGEYMPLRSRAMLSESFEADQCPKLDGLDVDPQSIELLRDEGICRNGG